MIHPLCTLTCLARCTASHQRLPLDRKAAILCDRDRIRSRPYAIAAVLTLDWPPDARQHLLLSDWLYVSGADSPPAGSEPAGQLIQRLLAEEQHVQWVLVAGKSEQEIIAVRRLAIEGRHREACK